VIHKFRKRHASSEKQAFRHCVEDDLVPQRCELVKLFVRWLAWTGSCVAFASDM